MPKDKIFQEKPPTKPLALIEDKKESGWTVQCCKCHKGFKDGILGSQRIKTKKGQAIETTFVCPVCSI